MAQCTGMLRYRAGADHLRMHAVELQSEAFSRAVGWSSFADDYPLEAKLSPCYSTNIGSCRRAGTEQCHNSVGFS